MAKITSPVADFRGVVAGVQFEDGQAETDNESALAYFERAGYTVDGETPEPADTPAYLQNPTGALGTPIVNPDGPLDAANPDNDLVPVGGVKSAAAPEAPEPSKASRARRKANTTDQPADTTPQEPVAANGGVQSGSSATTATTPSAAPVGDTTASDVTKVTPAPDPAAGTVSSSDVKTSDQVVLSDGTASNEAAKSDRPLPVQESAADGGTKDTTVDAQSTDTTKTGADKAPAKGA